MQITRNTSTSCETRRRLLESAGEVFAEHGFHNATVRQICELAGANVAAVNYHFRDKAELYDAVLQYSHCAAEAVFACNQPSADACAETRVKWYISTMMLRILDEGRPAWHGKLMSREMTEPSGALDKLVKAYFLPRLKYLETAVGELLGDLADEKLVERCCNSVIAQCVFYCHCKPLLLRMQPGLKYDRAGIESLVEHVTQFSMIAIRGVQDTLHIIRGST